MTLKYQTGEEIVVGDLVFWCGEAAEIELVAEPSSPDPEHEWYIQEYGGGVGVREPKRFGRVFISADQLPETEDLEFVARGDTQCALQDAAGVEICTIDWVKGRVRESSELSKASRANDALELLAVSIHSALKADKINWVQTLCRHASVIADSIGDLASVRRYRGLAMLHAPNNAKNLYGLADILLRQGDTENAKTMAATAYGLIRDSSDEMDRALAELLVKRWPELKNPTAKGE